MLTASPEVLIESLRRRPVEHGRPAPEVPPEEVPAEELGRAGGGEAGR